MPAYFKCPICGEDGQFGFCPTNCGMYYYHDRNDGKHCSHYNGDSGRVYPTKLEHFLCEVVRKTPDTPANKVWIEARIADIKGHSRKAKALYAEWQRLAEAEY